MKTPTNRIERLNLAASEELISRSRWLLTAGSMLPLMLLLEHAVLGTNRIGLPFLAFIIVGSALATGALWTKWQFRFYVVAFSFFALAIGNLLMIGKTEDKLYFWTLIACFWGMFGYSFWGMAGTVAPARAPGWEIEKSPVKSWWELLMSTPRRGDVIEFSWFCYTFRLLNSGQYWVAIVAFKRWGKLIPLGFAVRKPDEVEFLSQPDGKMRVRIGKRTMRATNLSPSGIANL